MVGGIVGIQYAAGGDRACDADKYVRWFGDPDSKICRKESPERSEVVLGAVIKLFL